MKRARSGRCAIGSASGTSVDLRIRRRRGALEEIEVAALVRLLDVAREDRAIAALELRLRRLPGGFPLLHLVLGDLEVQSLLLGVEFNQVAGLHVRERPADEGLGGDVEDAGAVAGAAHAA